MRLNRKSLTETAQWRKNGFTLPRFDIEAVAAETRANPVWVHFGAGNIFRAFPAARLQELLNTGAEKAGVIVAEGYDYEIIDAVFTPHDNLSLAVTLRSDGGIDKTVVASMVRALKADPAHPDFQRLREVFRAPSLRMVSFTITEKGYSLHHGNSLLPDVELDLRQGPLKAVSYMGRIVTLLYARFQAGRAPVAMVSMDNCSRNGDRLRDAVVAIARAWVEAGLAEADFLPYLEDPSTVSFPWTMIDKITPRPDSGVRKILAGLGFEDADGVATGKGTFVAPFVNAEETEYLVIEDAFPNGRIALDSVGIVYTDRGTVDKVEKMKVCTCLNPLHTALAIFGCLLSYSKIRDEMKDPDLKKLVEGIGYREGLPAVADPGIVNPEAFLRQCLEVRFPNPFMPDTPQRIATDTSQKLPIRFGETIKAYAAREDLDAGDLVLIPLVFAAWCRYLLGVDDAGNDFERSPDPLLIQLDTILADLKPGASRPYGKYLRPILSDAAIFGVDLYAVGLGEKVEGFFAEMMRGKNAVRTTLRKCLDQLEK